MENDDIFEITAGIYISSTILTEGLEINSQTLKFNLHNQQSVKWASEGNKLKVLTIYFIILSFKLL